MYNTSEKRNCLQNVLHHDERGISRKEEENNSGMLWDTQKNRLELTCEMDKHEEHLLHCYSHKI
jgi:hypothetical protein